MRALVSFSRPFSAVLVVIVGCACGKAQDSIKVARDVSAVRTICTEEFMRTQESNEVLFAVLDRFYAELEGQFRTQVQRNVAGVRFAYIGNQKEASLRFGPERTFAFAEAPERCDAEILSDGEIQAAAANSFSVTMFVDVRRNPTRAESRLSEADKGRVLTLWNHKVTARGFTSEKLKFAADSAALELLASFTSARRAAGSPDESAETDAMNPQPVTSSVPSWPPTRTKLSAGDIAATYSNAVVVLENYTAQGQKSTLGSGFILSAEGRVLTNYHVIRGASRMVARMRDQSTHEVEYIAGFDIENDLAALQIAGDGLPFVRLGSSSGVIVGDHVTALGSPLGLANTLSDGIISAVRGPGSPRWLQTSAPISHGSSGCPLFDDWGNVIAVAAAIVEAGENLNFAIPIDLARPVLTQTRHLSFEELRSMTEVRQSILNSSISIPPQIVSVDLVVPQQGGLISGSFSISGGLGNDLGVRLLSANGSVVWNAGVIQNSGNLNLRLRGGRYKLVFDNKVGPFWISSKTMSGTIEFSYYR
jgi:S1-C subfamily serine protease